MRDERRVTDAPAGLSWKNLPVLVVDDNATNRRILLEMLQQWGMKPTLAASGKEALVALQAVKESVAKFPLILVDAHMPEMDGFVLTQQIIAMREFRDATIIMLTSAGQPADAQRCRELGLTAYLTKPVGQSELLDTISGALGRPAQSARARGASPVAATLPAAKRVLDVLLAEDNVVNQKLAILLLERRGHTVTLAKNGKEALAALQKRDFDLCLMDVQMPELDGLETTAAIRAKEKGTSRHLPIVAMTAHAIKGDREICLAAGMDAYLSKPVRADELFQTIESLTAQNDAGGVAGGAAASGKPRNVAFDEEAFIARMDGSYEVCAQIAEAFFAEGPRLIGRLREELVRKDAAQLTRTAHALKGAIANFTDGTAFQSAVKLEQMGREGDLSAVTAALPRLATQVQELVEALRVFAGVGVKS